MEPNVPVRIDREAFDRILQRAAELQGASRDIGDGLTDEELLTLGTEVGIPVQHLRQALLEERTRITVANPDSTLDRWVGPADLVAQRVVQGTPETISAALTRWMERQEHFIVQRVTSERLTFEPMDPFAGAMRRVARMFDAKRGRPYLDKAELVTAAIMTLEPGFCHVTLAASLRRARASLVAGGLGLSFTGLATGGAIAVLGAPIWFAALPFVPLAAVGWGVARTFRGRSSRAQLGLERALDELQRRPALPGPGPQPPITGGLARGVGQVVREVAQEVRKALDK
ncbi:MAG TPA: hypothetical protein VGM20_14700 [Gemmatimonadales bacterium]|jgi:hypothetical protein